MLLYNPIQIFGTIRQFYFVFGLCQCVLFENDIKHQGMIQRNIHLICFLLALCENKKVARV